jgi:protease stability complex PrcB-like protein
MFVAFIVLQVLVMFETVAQGTDSNINESRQVVIRSAAEWQALWKAHDDDGATPVVDFARSVVLGVFLGSRPTAGFGAEVTAVKKEGERWVVEYLERRPPPGALTAQVLTSPYHLVSVPRDIGIVEFRRLQP